MATLPNPRESESIERKARHFVRWHPTVAARLQQLEEMTTFAGHFTPQWKTTNKTNLYSRQKWSKQ